MRFVMGVDGGGSKVACLVADETGRLLGYGRGGPANTNYVPRQQARASLIDAIGGALQGAGLTGGQIDTLCLSAPVVPELVTEVARAWGIGCVNHAPEGQTPRWAAAPWSDLRVGVTVDAGTGSLARGWTADGREVGAGGWGSTLGDEGSGHWIAMQAMVALLQAHDGRIAPTGLTAPVLEHFGLTSHLDMVFQVSHGLVTADESKEGVGPDSGSESTAQDAASVGLAFIHRRRRGPLARHEVASLCPTVVRVARQGDPKAAKILAQAGRELGRLAVAVIRRLGMEQEAFAVVPFGGVFGARELVLDTFEATFRAVAPGAQVVQPRFEPVVGGVLLALAEIGVDANDALLSILDQSASRFPACRAMGRT